MISLRKIDITNFFEAIQHGEKEKEDFTDDMLTHPPPIPQFLRQEVDSKQQKSSAFKSLYLWFGLLDLKSVALDWRFEFLLGKADVGHCFLLVLDWKIELCKAQVIS